MIRNLSRRNTRGKLAVFVMGALVASTSMVQGTSALVTRAALVADENQRAVGQIVSDLYTVTSSSTTPGDPFTGAWSIDDTVADGSFFDITNTNIRSTTGLLSFTNSPDFETPLDIGANNVYQVAISDGSGYVLHNVTVTNVNEAPTLPVVSAAVNAPENSTGAIATITPTDADSSSTFSYTLSGPDAGKFASITSGITGELAFAAGKNFESPDDSGNDGVYEVTVVATDGGSLTSNPRTYFVTLTNVNELPVVTTPVAKTVFENVTLVELISPADPDAGSTFTYALSGPDAALFSAISPGSTGSLVFATAPNFETKLDVGTNNVYNVTVTITDNGSATAVTVYTVTVADVNEAPVLPVINAILVNEGTSANVFDANATDQDVADTLTYSLGGVDAARFTLNPSTGVLTFTGIPDFETPIDAGIDNVYNLSITATDNGAGTLASSVQSFTVTVLNVNERGPVFSGAADYTIEVAENTLASTDVIDLAATDIDGNPITYSLAQIGDYLSFTIDSNTGVVEFISTKDFETPVDQNADGVYQITVRAEDNGDNFNTQAIFVTITDINDAPVLPTIPNVTVVEGNITTGVDANATDQDVADTLTYSLGGVDAARFTLNPTTGVLTFTSTPDFETPSDIGVNNVYNLSITATDNGTGTLASSVRSLTVTVLNNGLSGLVVTPKMGGFEFSVGAGLDAAFFYSWEICRGNNVAIQFCATPFTFLSSAPLTSVGGLDNNANYIVRVRSVSLNGAMSEYSEVQTSTTLDATGLQGLPGTNGLQGLQGLPGVDGTNGTNGTNGLQGLQGLQGLPGVDGTNGTNGTNGLQGLPGTNGTNGAAGAKGADGVAGPAGPVGATGPAGMLVSFSGTSSASVSTKSLAVLKKQAVKSGKVIRVYGYQTKLINGKKTVSLNRGKAIKAALLKINKNFDVRIVAAGAKQLKQCKTVKNNCAVIVFSNK